MWFSSLFADKRSSGPVGRKPASFRPTLETLAGRCLPSVAPLGAVDLGAAPALVGQPQAQETILAEGTFTVVSKYGSHSSVTIAGVLTITEADGSQETLTFEANTQVKVMGSPHGRGAHIEGSPTLVLADGSTLSFYYEVQRNNEAGAFEGRFWVTGGTGRFEGASGSGDISYPLAPGGSGPFALSGTLIYR